MSSPDETTKLRLRNLIDSRQPEHGLPRPFYHDEILFQIEMDTIWRQGWLFAGHSCQIPSPGDYFLYQIEGDSLIILRGDDGQVNVLHNVCRHRGSVICREAEG